MWVRYEHREEIGKKRKTSTRKDLGKVYVEVDNWMEMAAERFQ